MAGTAFLQNHPILTRKDLPKTIPIGLHGDAGAFSTTDSLFVLTWNSLLGVGTTMSKRWLMTIIKKSDVIPETLNAIFEILSWSFNVMLGGVWPELDWEGRPLPPRKEYLAGGLRGCLCQIRGDWEFHASIFGFPKWNGAVNMCWLCKASSGGPLAFTNFTADAPWRATKRTHESYLAELAADGRPVPTLFARVQGLRLESVMIDVLHTCDQGVASHVIGNVIQACCSRKAFHPGTLDQNLAALQERMDAWYKRHSVDSRLRGKLTKERVRTSGKWPKLKAKAAQTRHLAPFARELAEEFLDVRCQALCQLLCRFYEVLASQGMFLDEDAKLELPQVGRRLCGLYAQLSRESFQAGSKRWKMTPKVHLMLHLCEDQAPSVGNPKFYWVYADEDLVGQMVEVAEACHASTMAATAMAKWLVLIFEQE